MLSARARLVLAGIVRERLRDERRRWVRSGMPEPSWARELDAFVDSLAIYEDDAMTARRKLQAAASRRYRARRAAERARQRDGGAA